VSVSATAPAPQHFPHRFPLRVYFEDTDAGGMAYHASYLRWAERARTESLRAMGLPHNALMVCHNALLVVRRIEVEYARPARLDDALVVETRVRRVGGASVDLDQHVLPEAGGMPGGVPLARLRVGLACIRQDSLRPAALPEPWRGALRALAAEGD
jgi:acyl-CoA thioester hydrolase